MTDNNEVIFLKNKKVSVFLDEMDFLIAVEEGAFQNMPVLKEVSISYSPKLTFIHHGAFENCPYLRTVNLAGNGLFTVGDFGSKLPSLTMVNVEKVFSSLTSSESELQT